MSAPIRVWCTPQGWTWRCSVPTEGGLEGLSHLPQKVQMCRLYYDTAAAAADAGRKHLAVHPERHRAEYALED